MQLHIYVRFYTLYLQHTGIIYEIIEIVTNDVAISIINIHYI